MSVDYSSHTTAQLISLLNSTATISESEAATIDLTNFHAIDVGADLGLVHLLPSYILNMFTESQVLGMSLTQIQSLTNAQISALNVDIRQFLISAVENNTSSSTLEFSLAALNTELTSAIFSIVSDATEALGASDATIDVKLNLADAQGLFQYTLGDDTNIHVYLFSEYLKINYDGMSNESIRLADLGVADETLLLSNTNSVYPDCSWNGPVTSGSMSAATDIPLSWDFIQYLGKKSFNNFHSYTLFANVENKEMTLRKKINTEVNNQVNTVFNAFNVTSSTYNGNARLQDASGYYYTQLDESVSVDGSVDANDIMSLIFNAMTDAQPERFIAEPTVSNEQLISFPFRAGDKMSFLVKVNPDANQKMIVTASGSEGAQVPSRTYKVQINIV